MEIGIRGVLAADVERVRLRRGERYGGGRLRSNVLDGVETHD